MDSHTPCSSHCSSTRVEADARFGICSSGCGRRPNPCVELAHTEGPLSELDMSFEVGDTATRSSQQGRSGPGPDGAVDRFAVTTVPPQAPWLPEMPTLAPTGPTAP